tara:strand:- start:548 stop:1207 length:660 start_codon:yes stop_codon:yes gene_type:complete
MEFPYNIIKGGTTSLIALVVTYPIDIWKINHQSNIKSSVTFKTIYRGFARSTLLTFPEKGLKLGVYKYMKDKQEDKTKFNPIAAIISASCQGIFSTPIDNIKISNLHSKQVISHFSGLRFILGRDILFNMAFFYNTDNKTFTKNEPINNLLSASLATSIVTPIDVIKTRCQEQSLNNKKFNLKKFVKETPKKDYIKGIVGRNISVGIFYGISYTLFNYL